MRLRSVQYTLMRLRISLSAHKHRLLDYLNPSLWSLDTSHLDTCQCLIQLLGYWSHLIHTAWQADFLTMINNLSNWRDNGCCSAKTSTILPSITRRSLVYVAKEYLGLEVEERPVYFDEVKDFAECGLCGTAAVISPVGKIVDHGRKSACQAVWMRWDQ